MSTQITCIRGCKVTLVAICLTFLRCGFSNESSDCLPERMQIHIGCVYLIFLHGVLSYESSNCLPVRMQSHTVCICLIFLHCVFSNVSSNCLPQMEHSHTCCICLSFVQGHCCRSCMQKRANALDLSSMRILRSVVSQMTSSSITGVSNM